jgi:hypothetical protein
MPDHIVDPAEILDAYNRGEIGKSDYDFLNKQLTEMSTPEGAQLAAQKRAFVRDFKPLVDPNSPDVEAIGIDQTYQLERALDRRIERMRTAGKDPSDLFDPAKPDYILKSGTITGTSFSNPTDRTWTPENDHSAASHESSDEAGHSSKHAPSATPVSDVIRLPTFAPPIPPVMTPGTPEWTDNTIQSIQKLLDTYFANRHRSYEDSSKRPGLKYRSDDDQDFCYKRFEEETRECYDDKWIHAHPDYLAGCLERAQDRRTSCIKNGGRPHPREPLKWDPNNDEESWRNYDR